MERRKKMEKKVKRVLSLVKKEKKVKKELSLVKRVLSMVRKEKKVKRVVSLVRKGKKVKRELAANTVPVAAVVYHDDMYVDVTPADVDRILEELE